MTRNTLLILAVSVMALAGCTSTPSKVNTGTIHARTFSFVERRARPEFERPNENRETVHSFIQKSITQNLASKGVAKVPTGGDIIVSYLIIAGNNASSTMIDDYFGYGDDKSGLHEKAQAAYTDSKNPNYFEAGTLVIDLIDAKTFKLLKRGNATRPLLQKPTEELRAEHIQGVVEEILRDVRVSS